MSGLEVLASACSVEDCGRMSETTGMCSMHYIRVRRHGDPHVNLRTGPRPRHPLPEHGTTARYQRGCRCAPCRTAKNEYQRRWRNSEIRRYRPRVPDCLAAFGVSAEHVDEAGRVMGLASSTDTLEKRTAIHWMLWRNHGPFRLHCRCEVPEDLAEWITKTEVLA